jgi:glucosamine--fructose-6-phosphate aminotransferase (isomerizing)
MDFKSLHTYKEIISQPEIWQKTIGSFVETNKPKLPDLKSFDQIIVIGCGSTYYLSIWGARSIQARKGLTALAIPGSEIMLFTEKWLAKDAKTLLVAVSRSGTTSETLEAVKRFNQGGYGQSVSITCYPYAELAKNTDYIIAIPHAQEESIAQTRSFSSMTLGLSLLREGTVPAGIDEHLNNQGEKLFEDYLMWAKEIGINQALQRFFFLGSGPRYGLACETMLKMKEMSLSYSESFHFMEFRHGPMSMVNEKSIVIGLLGEEQSKYELDVLKHMKDLGAKILTIAPSAIDTNSTWIDYPITFKKKFNTYWEDVFYLPILQMIAFERALANDQNPDKPNNLEAVIVLNN